MILHLLPPGRLSCVYTLNISNIHEISERKAKDKWKESDSYICMFIYIQQPDRFTILYNVIPVQLRP